MAGPLEIFLVNGYANRNNSSLGESTQDIAGALHNGYKRNCTARKAVFKAKAREMSISTRRFPSGSGSAPSDWQTTTLKVADDSGTLQQFQSVSGCTGCQQYRQFKMGTRLRTLPIDL